MSVWSDIQDYNGMIKVRKEDMIADKEQLAEVLLDSAEKGSGDLAEILKMLEARIKDSIDEINKAFLVSIEDKNYLLTEHEKLLLQASLILPFQIGKYQSLENVLDKQKVKVIISQDTPRRFFPPVLKRILRRLEKELKLWKTKFPDIELTSSDNKLAIDEKSYNKYKKDDLEDLSELIDLINKLREEGIIWANMPLRGLYRPTEKEIYLYPENMKKEYQGKKMNELLVSTLSHETMHAYFNRYPHNLFKYIRHVEEPLAEFGMLLYLKETYLEEYFTWAKDDVEQKKTYYRYGATLMEQFNREKNPSLTRKDLESYKTFLF